jgi:hypothetical protein
MYSSDKQDTDLAKLLINGGANINSVTNLGNTALNLSIMYHAPDIAEMLLNAKADVTIKNKTNENALDLCKKWHSMTPASKISKWDHVKNRIEKLLVPQPIESKEIEVYVDANGQNAIEIPKIEKIIIRPYWSKGLSPRHHVSYEDRHIEGKVMSARRLENGKWIDCDITFPKDNDYIVKVPRDGKPEFHIIASASWFSPIQGDLIVRFDDFQYI